MVLRTGFETAQGSLLRTMAHTQKSVDGVNTGDTYVFILILLCFALASAGMVWEEGWDDPTRNKFRLTLHVVIIVTSVVPPERTFFFVKFVKLFVSSPCLSSYFFQLTS